MVAHSLSTAEWRNYDVTPTGSLRSGKRQKRRTKVRNYDKRSILDFYLTTGLKLKNLSLGKFLSCRVPIFNDLPSEPSSEFTPRSVFVNLQRFYIQSL